MVISMNSIINMEYSHKLSQLCPIVPIVLRPKRDGTVYYHNRLSPPVTFSACKIAPLAKAPSANLHIFSAPDPGGEPLLRRCLRQGYLQAVSDCPGKPSKQKLPSGSKALLFVRPAAGAPRRLRQRSASFLVERYAHDRVAVLVVRIVVLRSRAICTCRRVCGRRLRLVNLIYSSRIHAGFVLSLHGEMTVFIKMILLGDETVRCLATLLPGPALSSSHSGPLVWVARA